MSRTPGSRQASSASTAACAGPARRLSIATYRELIERWDGPAAVRVLHRPLLLLQGRNDRFQPVQQAELLAAAASKPTELRLLDTGHLPHHEDPDGLARLLAEWAARPAGPPSPPAPPAAPAECG